MSGLVVSSRARARVLYALAVHAHDLSLDTVSLVRVSGVRENVTSNIDR